MELNIHDAFDMIGGIHDELHVYQMQHNQLPLRLSSSKTSWKDVSDIERFIDKYLIEHFQREEEDIFPLIRTRAGGEHQGQLGNLEKEHIAILNQAEDFRKLIYSNIFPLKNEVLEKMRGLLTELMESLLKHVGEEDALMKTFGKTLKDDVKKGESISSSDGAIPADLQELAHILKEMSDAEILLSKMYHTFAQRAPWDEDFYLSVSRQEVHHAQNMIKMTYMISREPKKYLSNHIFKLSAIQVFKSGIDDQISRAIRGDLKPDQFLYVARDIERSVLESRYERVVTTQNVEYLDLMREITSETAEHRAKIDEKIRHIEVNGKK